MLVYLRPMLEVSSLFLSFPLKITKAVLRKCPPSVHFFCIYLLTLNTSNSLLQHKRLGNSSQSTEASLLQTLLTMVHCQMGQWNSHTLPSSMPWISFRIGQQFCKRPQLLRAHLLQRLRIMRKRKVGVYCWRKQWEIHHICFERPFISPYETLIAHHVQFISIQKKILHLLSSWTRWEHVYLCIYCGIVVLGWNRRVYASE